MIVATIHVLLASPVYLYVFTIRIEAWLGLPASNTSSDDRNVQLHESVQTKVDHQPMTDKQTYFQTPTETDAQLRIIDSCDEAADSDNYNDGSDEVDTFSDADDRIVSSTSVKNGEPEKVYVGTVLSPSENNDKRDGDENNSSNHYIVRRSVRFLEWLCNHPVLARVLLRSLEIATCALIAMLVPYFSDVMNLIGTVAAESLTFVLPCVFFIKLTWQNHSVDQKQRRTLSVMLECVVCASIALFGIFCICFGIVDAIAALTRDLYKQS